MPPNKNRHGIPDRWLDYQNVGKRIPGTRFISFKVPLKQALNRGLSQSEAFGPWDLLDTLKKQKEELGLMIDLTFTTRYYKLEDVPESLLWVKIFTAGHEVPGDATILNFKQVVSSFLQDNQDNDKLIGVHCTHGLNRTGYLVCRYLIDVDGVDPKKAIELFNSSRGHTIERDNYLQDLKAGPKRSNTLMKECKQEIQRGQAMSRPSSNHTDNREDHREDHRQEHREDYRKERREDYRKEHREDYRKEHREDYRKEHREDYRKDRQSHGDDHYTHGALPQRGWSQGYNSWSPRDHRPAPHLSRARLPAPYEAPAPQSRWSPHHPEAPSRWGPAHPHPQAQWRQPYHMEHSSRPRPFHPEADWSPTSHRTADRSARDQRDQRHAPASGYSQYSDRTRPRPQESDRGFHFDDATASRQTVVYRDNYR